MRNKITVIVFLLLLAAGTVLLALPGSGGSLEKENRTAAAMPKFSTDNVFSGKFASDFESFINDKVSFRSELMAFSDFIDSSMGIKPPGGKVIYSQKDIGTQTVKKASLLLLNGKIMEVFAEDKEAEDSYAERINEIAKAIPNDVKVYSMVIPTQLEFTEPVYKNIQTSQKKTIEYIYGKLSEKIKTVDAYAALNAHSDEYIYFGTDHHWTMLGSYYGYCALMKAQGKPSISHNDFSKHEVKDFYGALSLELDADDLKEVKADTIEWWDTQEKNEITTKMFGYSKGYAQEYHASPLLDEKQKDYSLFLTSDHPLAVITNNKLVNSQTILVIKDSYANDFVPWLVNDYRNIVMIDPRGFKGSIKDIVQEYKVNDVLIMNYIFTPTFADYSELLEEIM